MFRLSLSRSFEKSPAKRFLALVTLVLTLATWGAVTKELAEDSDTLSQSKTLFHKLETVDLGAGIYDLTASQKTEPEGEEPLQYGTLALLYNDRFPGAQMEVLPGEELQIRLINRLQPIDSDTLEGLFPPVLRRQEPQSTKDLIAASSSITNLHTHGLHVSPGERSDNVLLKILSGKENLYTIDLPATHAPGTHWYHAHLHGSTALQVQGGMVGALIVEPLSQDQDMNPPGFSVQEHVMVLQLGKGWELNRQANLRRKSWMSRLSRLKPSQLTELAHIETPEKLAEFANRFADGDLEEFTQALIDFQVDLPPALVNGAERSVLQLQQKEAVQRLRVINAGARRDDFKELWIQGEDGTSLPMYLGAFDGVNLTELPKDATGQYIAYTESNKLVLGAGNRADIFFVPESTGTFELMMEGEIGLRAEKESGASDEAPGPARLKFRRSLLTLEIGEQDLSERAPKDEASAADSQEFLNALDKHLQELQQRIFAYDKGYLRPFEEHEEYIPRTIRFSIKGSGVGQHTFFINDRSYNQAKEGHQAVDHSSSGGHDHMKGITDYLGKVAGDGGRGPNGQTPWPLRSGTEEEWIITNTSNQPHPFHIHVSPFWVVNLIERENPNPNSACTNAGEKINVRETNPYDPRIDRWQDTIILPPCGSVKVRHRVSNFHGVYVLHCHILQHEDRGMMMNVLTVPNRTEHPQVYFERVMRRNEQINEEINGS